MRKPHLTIEDERKIEKYESIMSELDDILEEYEEEDVFVSAMMCKLFEIYTGGAITKGGAQESMHNLLKKFALGCALYMEATTFDGEESIQ